MIFCKKTHRLYYFNFEAAKMGQTIIIMYYREKKIANKAQLNLYPSTFCYKNMK